MIPPILVLFPIPPAKRSTSRSRPPIFIPHLSYPTSRLDFRPNPPSRQTYVGLPDFAQSTQTENVPKSSVPDSSTVGTSGTTAVRRRVKMVLLYLCSIGVSPKGFQVCKGSLRNYQSVLEYVFQLPTNNIEKEVIKINKRNGNLAMNTSPGGSSCSLFPD